MIASIDGEDLSPEDLSTALRVVVEANDLGVGELRLSVYNGEGDFLPLTKIARELDRSIPERDHDTELIISLEDARRLGTISEHDAGQS